MLEFIVLGQVPGTNFQITFNLIRGILLLLLAMMLIRLDLRLYHGPKAYKLTTQSARSRRILGYTVDEFREWLKNRYSLITAIARRTLLWTAGKLATGVKKTWTAMVRVAAMLYTAMLNLTRRLQTYLSRQMARGLIALRTRILPEVSRVAANTLKQGHAGLSHTTKRLWLWYVDRRTT